MGGTYQPCATTHYQSHSDLFETEKETSCDGFDNDCDGQVDDDFPLTLLDGSVATGVGTGCGVGACAGGEVVCVEGVNAVECTTESSASGEVCDGVDNDCDGLTDADDAEDLASSPTLCENQNGVCLGSTKPTTLCVDGQWLGCGDDQYGLASPLYQTGTEWSCDSKDNDCDGVVDEDFVDTDDDGAADCVDLDDDNDTLFDEIDNCPLHVNPDQKDFDSDQQGDVCDADDDGDLSKDEVDCDPYDPVVYPGAEELCDGKDNNCKWGIDEGKLDTDQDGQADCVDTDDDNDTVPDLDDNCPKKSNDGQEDADKDYAGDVCDEDDASSSSHTSPA
jgi:hypothetical protein